MVNVSPAVIGNLSINTASLSAQKGATRDKRARERRSEVNVQRPRDHGLQDHMRRWVRARSRERGARGSKRAKRQAVRAESANQISEVSRLRTRLRRAQEVRPACIAMRSIAGRGLATASKLRSEDGLTLPVAPERTAALLPLPRNLGTIFFRTLRIWATRPEGQTPTSCPLEGRSGESGQRDSNPTSQRRKYTRCRCHKGAGARNK